MFSPDPPGVKHREMAMCNPASDSRCVIHVPHFPFGACRIGRQEGRGGRDGYVALRFVGLSDVLCMFFLFFFSLLPTSRFFCCQYSRADFSMVPMRVNLNKSPVFLVGWGGWDRTRHDDDDDNDERDEGPRRQPPTPQPPSQKKKTRQTKRETKRNDSKPGFLLVTLL